MDVAIPRSLPEILLIEDSAIDIQVTREGLAELRRPLNLTVISDGHQAISYLRDAIAPPATRPDLVLLDLNLPGCRGSDVLASIKGDPALAEIPVVIMTSSRSEDDIRASYRAHANCYVVKPLEVDDFVGLIKELAVFWLDTAARPSS